MIAKGNARANGPQLAAHLMNTRDNERVELAGIDGSAATDLRGLFAEWELQAEQTNCRQFIYHLSVSPDPGQGGMTREQYFEFLDRAAVALGMGAQARAVVFHGKRTREHCHAAWSRIDVGAGRAIALSHDRMTLRRVVQEFALDHGIQLSAGLQADRGSERTGSRHTNQAEQKQQERSGQTKAERMALITAAWRQHDTARGFVEAIGREGFALARGDGQQRKAGKESQPVYVVIDRAGEVHSLARQIEGVKAKEMFTRLQTGYALDSLPDAATARAAINDNQQGRGVANDLGRAVGKEVQQATIDRDAEAAKSQDAIDSAGIAYAEERRRQFNQTQAAERAALERHGVEMTARHAATWTAIGQRHQAETAGLFDGGVTGYQHGTMEDAEQAAATGVSFLLGLFMSWAEGITRSMAGSPKAAPQRPRLPDKVKDKQAARQAEQQREAHSRELEAVMQEQARERASHERRRAQMLFEQAGALQSFEQAIADKSSMREAFEKHGEQVDGYKAYQAEKAEKAERTTGRDGAERDGPELG